MTEQRRCASIRQPLQPPLVGALESLAMLAAPSLFPLQSSEKGQQRILLSSVSWQAYVTLRDGIKSGAVRMAYLLGRLEIMTPKPLHEVTRKQIARPSELLWLARDIPLFGPGQLSYQDEETERGLERDECYARDKDKPISDVALEIMVPRGVLDELEGYRGLGVREVWVLEAGEFRILTLRADDYEVVATSELLPKPDLARIAYFCRTARSARRAARIARRTARGDRGVA